PPFSRRAHRLRSVASDRRGRREDRGGRREGRYLGVPRLRGVLVLRGTFRRPDIKGIGKLFFVVGAIGQAHQRATVALIKAPGANILLEGPELKTFRMFLAYSLEQPAARIRIEARRIDVEMMEPTVMNNGEAHHLAVAIGDPGLGLTHDAAYEVTRFVVGVEM